MTETGKEYVVLRLDRSRSYGIVRGEVTQSNPAYGVAYQQDGLYFDARGALVPPGDQKEPWFEVITDDAGRERTVRHYPLWTKEMYATYEKKVAKLKVRETPDEPEAEESDDVTLQGEQVNLEAWLRGNFLYEPFEIFAAVKERYHQNMHRVRDVVQHLVEEERLVPEGEVAGYLMRMLDTRAASRAA